ncbi:Protein of unknown function [Bacillus cereus]|jgi:Kinesin motor domain
MVYG